MPKDLSNASAKSEPSSSKNNEMIAPNAWPKFTPHALCNRCTSIMQYSDFSKPISLFNFMLDFSASIYF